MGRKSSPGPRSGRTVLLVDDDPDYRTATRMLLEREGHTVTLAQSGQRALELVREQPVDLMLLDYYMPGMTGEEVVRSLRSFNPTLQVILQTGYASEQPPREMLKRLDIQGYYDKGEGPEKLLLWTDVGLKAAYTVQLLERSRKGLDYILDITPDLHKIQPLDDLLEAVLLQLSGLIGAANACLAVSQAHGVDNETEAALAMLDDEQDLVIRAATGHFTGRTSLLDVIEPAEREAVRTALQSGGVQQAEEATVVPLQVGNSVSGILFVDQPAVSPEDIELLQIFANQAAVAIHNNELYSLAALDTLTGVFTRGFFEDWLRKELRSAYRSLKPLSMMMVDVDGMKWINDTWGHLEGDRSLASLGDVLRRVTRQTEIVGRYGGDEFAVLLPDSTAGEARKLGDRLLTTLQRQSQPESDRPARPDCSIGICCLNPRSVDSRAIDRPISGEYFDRMAKILLEGADEVMYRAKRDGGGRLEVGPDLEWDQPLGKAI